jgi:hypothetical protein
MSADNIVPFLRTLAARPELLLSLRARSKDEVLTAAAGLGLPFSDDEFNTVVWDLEEQLAARRGEAFDDTFTLWQVMWGQFYLGYLVTDLLPSLVDTGLAEPVGGSR